MQPIKTKASNFTYLGPDDDCGDLPCEVSGNDTYSIWKLSDADREVIAKGGHIKLGIHGARPIPPVSLGVVENDGPNEFVNSPCDTCGNVTTDPVHGTGPGTHAYRSRNTPNNN